MVFCDGSMPCRGKGSILEFPPKRSIGRYNFRRHRLDREKLQDSEVLKRSDIEKISMIAPSL